MVVRTDFQMMVTHNFMGGTEFNKDGTKMFVSYHNVDATKLDNDGDIDYIAEYNLSTPFDISQSYLCR